MRTIIAGSRLITDYQHVLIAIGNSGINITQVVSGTANGVDQLGEKFAGEHDIEVVRFPANWDKFGKKAGYLRNIEMAEHADALIAVYNGTSRGTQHMTNIAKRRGLHVYVYNINEQCTKYNIKSFTEI